MERKIYILGIAYTVEEVEVVTRMPHSNPLIVTREEEVNNGKR